MNLFRSEEHIARWLGGRPPGATIPATQLCDLAHAWWGDRIDPEREKEVIDRVKTGVTIVTGEVDAEQNERGESPRRWPSKGPQDHQDQAPHCASGHPS